MITSKTAYSEHTHEKWSSNLERGQGQLSNPHWHTVTLSSDVVNRSEILPESKIWACMHLCIITDTQVSASHIIGYFGDTNGFANRVFDRCCIFG